MNEYEIEGRLRKATALVEQAKSEQMVRIDLEMMTPEMWLELALKAGVNPPSEKTISVTIALMPEEATT